MVKRKTKKILGAPKAKVPSYSSKKILKDFSKGNVKLVKGETKDYMEKEIENERSWLFK